MNKALWAVQILLALLFGMSGAMKGFAPEAMLLENMPWIETTGVAAARLAGISEVLGAIGLILPAALRVQPKLTGLAGAGLAIVMVLAAGLHLVRSEFVMIVPNVVLGSLAAFVAWGRLKAHPIAPRESTAVTS